MQVHSAMEKEGDRSAVPKGKYFLWLLSKKNLRAFSFSEWASGLLPFLPEGFFFFWLLCSLGSLSNCERTSPSDNGCLLPVSSQVLPSLLLVGHSSLVTHAEQPACRCVWKGVSLHSVIVENFLQSKTENRSLPKEKKSAQSCSGQPALTSSPVSELCLSLLVCLRGGQLGELLWEPCGGCVWEDDEPRLLGQVQAPHPLQDFPGNDPPALSSCPRLRYPHPDPPQMAVRPGGCAKPDSAPFREARGECRCSLKYFLTHKSGLYFCGGEDFKPSPSVVVPNLSLLPETAHSPPCPTHGFQLAFRR